MFQQHHGESLSEAWTHFKDLLQKVPHHGIDRWLQIQNFYDHVSFHLKYEIDRAADSKLRNKNTNESWEIIKNLTLYDHEGWDETKEFVKPVKAISTSQGISKIPNWRLLELEDQINFLLKGARPTPTLCSAHTPQAYANAFHLNSRPQNQNELPKLNTFDYRERTETKFPITKNVNSISLARNEEEENNKTDETPDNTKMPTETEIPVRKTEAMNEVENGAGNKSIITPENDEAVEASGSLPVGYYLKHKIEKLIKGLVKNNKFNNSRSGTQDRMKKGKEYKVLPGGPAYEGILKKKITKKEDIGGNLEIPCGIGDLKHVNALNDQGSDVNVMPYSTYMRLTNERPAETDIRLSLASHSYIYPLGIAKDVLVEVAEHVFPVDFVILDIKEKKKRPFILGTPFLTTTKATIKFDTCTITLRSGKSKISFHRISDSSYITDIGVKKDIEPIAPIMTVNRLALEWEERIKLHLKKEMKFNQ
ncbi:MAK10-like protein [Tanacetum coccineum]|uniref:MAK10-like protein n=1 Tax=Tanacetum coccineum TaxID=301880 RepID=A0ABQ5H7X8_9ASTR